jgi:hypothetical protein
MDDFLLLLKAEVDAPLINYAKSRYCIKDYRDCFHIALNAPRIVYSAESQFPSRCHVPISPEFREIRFQKENIYFLFCFVIFYASGANDGSDEGIGILR